MNEFLFSTENRRTNTTRREEEEEKNMYDKLE
jgi:hypothetical protein